jgi:glycosyltransferase involved in cell wall biosynthesis
MALIAVTHHQQMQPRVMTLVHDSHTYGGMELHMLMVLKYLDPARYTPTVYVPGYTEPYWTTPQQFINEIQEMGVKLLRPPHPGRLPGISFARDLFHTRQLFKQAGVNIVHIHTNHPKGARKATIAARMAGVGAVLRSEHLPPTHFGLTAAVRHSTRLFDMLTDCVIAGSQACYDEQVAAMGRKKVHLSFYGIELDRFNPSHDVQEAKRRLGLSPSLPVVGAIGRLSELKGHTYFIKAAERVLKKYGPVNFVLVGDGPLRQELTEQVAASGLGPYFHFAGYQKDTIPYMEAIDVAVMPTSINEGISLAMLEFMAMGKPMVATDDPSFSETVVDGESGLIVPKRDSEALAGGILTMLREPELAHTLRREALRLVHGRFNIRRQVSELMDLYDFYLQTPQRARV